MKTRKADISIEALRLNKKVSARLTSCCSGVGIFTVNQLVDFYITHGTFTNIPQCGLITHYELLSICMEYLQPDDNIELSYKEFKRVLNMFPKLLDSFSYDYTPDMENAPMKNDIRIKMKQNKLHQPSVPEQTATLKIWTSPPCYWCSEELPGFKYSEKKKAWWKRK